MICIVVAAYVILNAGIIIFFGALFLILAAAFLPRRAAVEIGSTSARFMVVVPAHDEEGNIRSTVASCRAVAYDPALFRVFVIADNCTDETARVARESGAVVVERVDHERRSKGHALDYFFEYAHAAGLDRSYDAAVVIDADTVVDPDLLTAYAAALAEGKEWIQCYYTVRNPDASWRTRLMTYAFSLCNGVWLLGQDRLGLSVGLKGNGMCFATRALARVPWKAYGLAEDQEFAWRLRIAGERVHFLPRIRVYADMLGRGGKAAVTQRHRWEAGRRALRGAFLIPLLRSRSIHLFPKIMYLIDLYFPPLVTLLIALLVALSLHATARWEPRLSPLAHGLWPVHVGVMAVLACYALSPILVMRLPARYLSSLLSLPCYAVWKMHVTMMARRTTGWVRTQREPITREASG